jgi:DNA-binding NtrC family response regulator
VHVLIVDDDSSVRRALAQELAAHTVALAAGYQEALDALHTESPLDALVSDLRMGPGPDGLALCAVARRVRPAARRVLVTGTPYSPGVAEALAAGTIACVVLKPWRPGEVEAVLRRLG